MRQPAEEKRFEKAYTHFYESPLGGILLAGDGERLTGLWFEGQKHYAEGLSPRREEAWLPVFDEAKRWLDLYFSGRAPGFMPPLRLRGTDFRRAVWETLLMIPYGKTMTYGEVAERVAARMGLARTSARAVGGAVGRNPVSLVIPCHRVVGADGSLTGYAGGIGRKLRLLRLEGADMRGLRVPDGEAEA